VEKLYFCFGQKESKTSYGNFPLTKKSYFVWKVTPYRQSKFGSGGFVKAMNICKKKLFSTFPHCKRIHSIYIYYGRHIRTCRTCIATRLYVTLRLTIVDMMAVKWLRKRPKHLWFCPSPIWKPVGMLPPISSQSAALLP